MVILCMITENTQAGIQVGRMEVLVDVLVKWPADCIESNDINYDQESCSQQLKGVQKKKINDNGVDISRHTSLPLCLTMWISV